MPIRFLTAGESHGKCLNTIIEGLPSGVSIDKAFINNELSRRQMGYGRGGRMKIESDQVEILSGVRFGISTGSPICLEIKNKDWENWQTAMSTEPQDFSDKNIAEIIASKKITKLRPGHADYAGFIKYNFDDIRNVLERSSARETATRTATGAICKLLLKEFGITGFSHVIEIGEIQSSFNLSDLNKLQKDAEKSELRCANFETTLKMKEEIDKAQQIGTSLGGKIQIIFKNLPVGLGSYVHWDKRLDSQLAQALMSIPAVKSVEIGLGALSGKKCGHDVHDEIFYKDNKITRTTNNAGGLEGGMTNGEPVIITITMKPIPTMRKALKSIDIETKQPLEAHFERADVCAVPACGVVAEAMCAYVFANSFLEKFGSDNLFDIKNNFHAYLQRLENI